MPDSMLKAQIESASAYERLFVPALFGQWAPRVANAAGIAAGDRVLDVACGTGVLAREAAQRAGPHGKVTGVDPAAGMLAVAARLAPSIEWREGAAEALPFPHEAFDVVVSQFGLMLFTDRELAVREMLRVLAPGGRLAVAVWNEIGSNPAYKDEAALLEEIAGRRAADAIRSPFSLGDRDRLAALFVAAGMTKVTVDTLEGKARFPDIRTMVEADLRGWLPVTGVVLAEDEIAEVLMRAEQALASYRAPDGTVAFAVSAHLLTGRKSHDTECAASSKPTMRAFSSPCQGAARQWRSNSGSPSSPHRR